MTMNIYFHLLHLKIEFDLDYNIIMYKLNNINIIYKKIISNSNQIKGE